MIVSSKNVTDNARKIAVLRILCTLSILFAWSVGFFSIFGGSSVVEELIDPILITAISVSALSALKQ